MDDRAKGAAIPEATVAEVVREVSERMSEPSYAQLAIGGVAQAHPDVARFVAAHADELGGGEGVMHAVFHAHVIDAVFERHRGRPTRALRFRDLDAASKGDVQARLSVRQPALADYVVSNVEEIAVRRILALIALALSDAR